MDFAAGFFSGSSHLLIQGGTFIEHRNFNFTDALLSARADQQACQRGWEKLCQSIAVGVFHHSEARWNAPRCLPGSHDKILEAIMGWIKDPTKTRRCLWVHGAEGSGKTRIAQTVADLCYEAGFPLATFFFSDVLRNGTAEYRFITTIVYQLCTMIPELRDVVGRIIDRNPAVLTLSLVHQFHELILIPIYLVLRDETIKKRLENNAIIIIVDGLDAAGSGAIQRRILDILATAMLHPELPFTFVIACRPEYHLRLSFLSQPLRILTVGLPLDDSFQIDSEIGDLDTIPSCGELVVRRQAALPPFLARMLEGVIYSTSDLLRPIQVGFERLLQTSLGDCHDQHGLIVPPKGLSTQTDKIYRQPTFNFAPNISIMHVNLQLSSRTSLSQSVIPGATVTSTLFGHFIDRFKPLETPQRDENLFPCNKFIVNGYPWNVNFIKSHLTDLLQYHSAKILAIDDDSDPDSIKAAILMFQASHTGCFFLLLRRSETWFYIH